MGDTSALTYSGTHGDGRPFGMPRKQYALLLDTRGFAEWVKERNLNAQSEDGAMAFICAQVASGCSLKTLSEHYLIDYGLLWGYVSEDNDRLSRYEQAQRGVAEYYVSETVDIADEQAEVVKKDGSTFDPDVPRDKLRIDTRLKVAARWNRARYGEAPAMAINVGANSLVQILSGLPSAAAGPELEEGETLDVVVEPEPPAPEVPEKIPAENSEIPEKLAEPSRAAPSRATLDESNLL